ncbi:uncharacterized protein LOC131213144 [Anopheles bellator]|uniref:uncharacterized protein LOC131213144 n=1 Tax=Anopheles bellator TaxID=139047 RepID=UPI002647480D|nr:uncharacterized protein LOC131213144 [Anopheles bellator]
MPPKVQKCSICGTITTEKWYMLDRRSICSVCHDIQLNPPLEPLHERSNERPAAAAAGSNVANDNKVEPIDEEDITAATSKKMDVGKNHLIAPDKSAEGMEHAGMSAAEQSEVTDTVAPLGMYSPRRLRRRICPVTRPPVRRRVNKTGRAHFNSKAKSRRTLLKKPPTKSTCETASTKTVAQLFHENICFHESDIVSLVDVKDNIYYAQIRGLLIDTYREKSATLMWLLPTTSSPPPNVSFNPATYIAGPVEETPRRLAYMKFVMSAPSNYFFDRHNPFPRPETYGPTNTTQGNNRNYVWTNIAHLHYGDRF